MPSRFAARELKLTYLERVQEETHIFMNERIKHDFMKPDRQLTLDLSVREAELLMAASQEVRDLADSGDLKKIHSAAFETRERAEREYLGVREHIQKIIHQVEEKENEIYAQLQENFGLDKVRKHGQSSLLDILSFSASDPIFANLAMVDGAIEHNHESADQLRVIQAKLQAYIGVKAKFFEIETLLKDEYSKKVAPGDPLVSEELSTAAALKKSYTEAFESFGDSAS